MTLEIVPHIIHGNIHGVAKFLTMSEFIGKCYYFSQINNIIVELRKGQIFSN